MTVRKKVCVLLSGGMDSVTALYESIQRYEVLYSISFKYGAKHNHKEIPFAQLHSWRVGIDHHVVELGFIADHFKSDLLKTGGEIPEGHYEDVSMKSTVVPFRNGIMLSIAAGFAESVGASSLVIASHAGDHAIYPDCREDFMVTMSKAISLGTYGNIGIERPFISMTKADIAKLGSELNVDYSLTWSCYKGEKWHCGKCGTCVERMEAFALSGIKDPTHYEDLK